MLNAYCFTSVNLINSQLRIDFLLEEINDLIWEVNYLHEEVDNILAEREEQELHFPSAE